MEERETYAVDAVPLGEKSLRELLEDTLPIKRQVNVEGFPRPVWIWRLELCEILELSAKRRMIQDGDERSLQEWGIEMLAMCLGDSKVPGIFKDARGRSWLRRQPAVIATLIPVATEFNELTGPHPDRKKKSESPIDCEPSSTSQPGLE